MEELKELILEESTLKVVAIKEKKTQRYVKYIIQSTEDPPEIVPGYIYVGNHLADINQILIELREG